MSQPLEYASPSAPPPKGALGIIFLIVFMDLLGFGLIIPLLPFYVPDQQERPLLVGLLFSAYSICQFAAAPVLGAISDRYGRRPVLIVSQFGSAAGYLLLGWVSLQSWRLSGLGLALIYLSRVIDGLSGGNVSTAQAYVSDVTTPENRAKGMGLLGAAFGIGFAAGPAFGGVLGNFHPAYPAFAAAALSFIAGLLTWLRLPESNVHKRTSAGFWLQPSQLRPILGQSVLLQLLLISFISMASFVMMETAIPLFLSHDDTFDFGPLRVGLFFAAAGVVIVIVQGGLIGRLTRRFGEWPLAAYGPALVTLGMLGFTAARWMPLLPLLGLALVMNATGRSLQHPTISSLISKHSRRDQQGVVFGMYHGLSSLARVIGPLVAGLAYSLHITAPFLIAGVVTACAALWVASLRAFAARQPAEPVMSTAAA